ncbi:ABC transporter ATP-binding protein [Sporofaciens sp. JLR.KK001]|uniref:ABC transporter ATP-binding protein n=1 Tax=Sporofaciens sp. JLR.KK001 TaxID=3112621 RepID=UPI002FEEB4E7
MFKTLVKYIGEFKRDAILTPVLVVMEVIMEVIIPIIMAAIIDYGLESRSLGKVVLIGLGMIVAALLALWFGVESGRTASSASSGFAMNLRKAMYEKIQAFSFSNIDKFSTAGLVTRMTTDVMNVQQAFQMSIRICVRAPIMLVSAMVMTFMIHPRFARIFLVVIVCLAAVLALISSKANPTLRKVFHQYDELNAKVQENVNGIRVVKSFVREDHEIGRFETESEKIRSLFVSAEKLLALNSPVMQFSMYSCILLISWMGAKMIIAGSLTEGQLMSMFTYVINILISLMMVSMTFVMLIMSRASGERISEVLTEEPDLFNVPHAIREVADGSIDFEQVGFAYPSNPGKEVISDLNLHIRPGETIGVLGGTGSAKSSFAALIPRLYDVTRGEVRVGGIPVKDYDMASLRDSVAVVLQKNVLFSGKIKENLRWGKEDATDDEIINACRLAQADEFIRDFPAGYDTHIERGGANVSGGQKQRLCIARALLKKPKILILDDSTSAVDTKTDVLIRRAFREKIPDTTKIIIAQKISSIQDADRILVFDNGRMKSAGTHEELLENSPIYREIYESQTKEGGDDDRRE